jgi:hypothetical protein
MIDTEDRKDRAARYRAVAERIRNLAGRIPYDFKRRAQLEALAGGFQRSADRLDAAREPSAPNDRRR